MTALDTNSVPLDSNLNVQDMISENADNKAFDKSNAKKSFLKRLFSLKGKDATDNMTTKNDQALDAKALSDHDKSGNEASSYKALSDDSLKATSSSLGEAISDTLDVATDYIKSAEEVAKSTDSNESQDSAKEIVAKTSHESSNDTTKRSTPVSVDEVSALSSKSVNPNVTVSASVNAGQSATANASAPASANSALNEKNSEAKESAAKSVESDAFNDKGAAVVHERESLQQGNANVGTHHEGASFGPNIIPVGASISSSDKEEEEQKAQEAYLQAKSHRGHQLEHIRDEDFHGSHALSNRELIFVSQCRFGWYLDAIHADIMQQMDHGDFCFKNCKQIELYKNDFAMGFAVWHSQHFGINDCWFEKSAYSPLWFCHHGVIKDTSFGGNKSVRESLDITLLNCYIDGDDFGWKCSALDIKNCSIKSKRALLDSHNLEIRDSLITSDNVLCHIEEAFIENTEIASNEALWNAKNVTLKHCKISGDSFGWNSENITLIDCDLCGHRALCFSRNIKLVRCHMAESTNAFMGSTVDVDVEGSLGSILSPRSGTIKCDTLGAFNHVAAEFEDNVKVETTKPN